MNRFAIYALLFVPLFANAALLGTERTWEFMQAVGGIRLGKPVLEGGTWRLPLQCDVSGLKSVTRIPAVMNSALVVADIKADTSRDEIAITIETRLPGAGRKPACEAINLGYLTAGKYRVMYRDPDGAKYLVGEIEIAAGM